MLELVGQAHHGRGAGASSISALMRHLLLLHLGDNVHVGSTAAARVVVGHLARGADGLIGDQRAVGALERPALVGITDVGGA